MIKKVNLDNKAIEYIRNELLSGNDLATFLLKLPLETGHVTTYLHDALNSEDIEGFNLSIFLTKNLVMMNDTHDQMIDFISTHLESSRDSYAIFETLGELGEGWLKSITVPYFSYNSKIYICLACTDTSAEMIKSAMGKARGYPFICALTYFNLAITNGEVLSEDKLETLAKSVDHVVIGAYDEEGFLIWSKS